MIKRDCVFFLQVIDECRVVDGYNEDGSVKWHYGNHYAGEVCQWDGNWEMECKDCPYYEKWANQEPIDADDAPF